MAIEPKVVWSEGIFITPQHFQQFDRYIESGLRQLSILREGFYWGFTALELDTSGLKQGVIGINAAEGVFPDGSIFSFTEIRFSISDKASLLNIKYNFIIALTIQIASVILKIIGNTMHIY